MARARTTKELAQRIDLNYFKRPTPLKHAKFWLSLGVPLLALLWIVGRGISSDRRVYSRGSLSRAHAVLENECAACHVRQAGGFSRKPPIAPASTAMTGLSTTLPGSFHRAAPRVTLL